MSKLKRKQKALIGFEVDKLDNTANIKKIVDDMQHKNFNAFKLYSKVLGRRQKNTTGDHWTLVGHPISAFTDDWSGDLDLDYFEQFAYKGTHPKIITPMKNIDKCDPLTEYMKVKSDWAHDMLVLSSRSESFLKNYVKLNDEVSYCPKHFVNIAEHYNTDPDPNFDSSYNWYYAGHGNIQMISCNFVDYLLHSEFSKLYLSEFSLLEMKIIANQVVTFDCGKQNNILETICSTDNIVILRTMYRLFILKIVVTDENISIEKLKEIQSKIAFTSISLDSYHKNILYVTKLDNNLTIVNLDRMTGRNVMLCKATSLVDNWNSVVPVDRNNYCHIVSDIITLYDKRTNMASGSWKDLKNLSDWTCNEVTAARKYENSLYLGTNHHMFVLDMRCCDSFKPKILTRWTHNMLCSPTYFSQSCFEGTKELICLSSQWCEDMSLFASDAPNIMRRGHSTGVTPLYRPPSITATLKEARLKLLCNDLYNPIDNRVLTSITGVLLLEIDDKYAVLMQNSLGDITTHTIYPEHLEMFMENDSAEALDTWNKGYIMEPKVFEVTDVVNLANMLNDLKKVPENSTYLDGEMMDEDKYSESEIKETFSAEKIDSGLLEAWNFELDENKSEQSLSITMND